MPRALLTLMFASAGLVCSCVFAQYPRKPADRLMQVDDEGVLRWQDDGSEVALFGVNYYTPCSIDYASIKALGVDHKETIDQDLVHFERMGLGALRLHVFDREISDEQGNLIDNHHLELLDYLIAEAKKRGIYTVLTPMAWWGSPEDTHGFSDVYSKAEMYTDPNAIEAQGNYLEQFVTHKNRYTGLTYANDPAVPCFEIINEPIPAPRTDDDVIVSYIDTMCDAIRETGCEKPIFFNGWGNRHDAVRRSKADGCTFGWYPSGLVSGGMLTANFLPRVNDYPGMRDEELKGKAKIVYEFDAADIPGSYMYPAMARAFRSGGAQIAAQFQYEPLPVAPTNADWQTHYLNLIYTPKQAVSFAIAAEAFRRLPRLKTYGKYPECDRFGDFRVSYEEQLSEMVTGEVFMYSNDTKTKPPAPRKLTRVVGCGSSPVVHYDGTGAYFLERLARGVWRLEAYPDCVWVDDPHGPTNLGRETARVYRRERKMTVALPDLGREIVAVRLAGGELKSQRATDGTLTVRPGVYVLRGRDASDRAFEVGSEFVAPPSSDAPTAVWHIPARSLLEGKPLVVRATVATAADPDSVTLHLRDPDGGSGRAIEMKQVAAYRYETSAPGDLTRKGELTYCITVTTEERRLTFPDPDARDLAGRFVKRDPVTVLEFTGTEPLPEMTVGGAENETAKAEFVPGSEDGRAAARFTATGFGKPPSATGSRWPVTTSGDALAGYNTLVVRARSIEQGTSHVEVGCIHADGKAYGYDVPLSPAFTDFRVPIRQMRGLWGTWQSRLQPEQLREISLNFGSWLFPHAADQAHGLEIERVALAYEPEAWSVPVHGLEDPFVIFAPKAPIRGIRSEVGYRQWIAPGSQPDATAWRMEVSAFEEAPSCTSIRSDISELVAARRPAVADCDTLHIRARAVEERTTGVEIVLSEKDGAPWGFTPKITTEWQDIRVPLGELRFFAHWAHPEGRGGEGDSCRPEDLASVHITFGAWLYPDAFDRRHAFEIEFIRLEKSGAE